MKRLLTFLKGKVVRAYYQYMYGTGAFPIELDFRKSNLRITSHAGGYKDPSKDYVSVLVYNVSGAYALPFADMEFNRESWNTIRDQVDGMFAGLDSAKSTNPQVVQHEQSESDIEQELKTILANKSLSRAAFADPEIRSRVRPLFGYFKKYGYRGVCV